VTVKHKKITVRCYHGLAAVTQQLIAAIKTKIFTPTQPFIKKLIYYMN